LTNISGEFLLVYFFTTFELGGRIEYGCNSLGMGMDRWPTLRAFSPCNGCWSHDCSYVLVNIHIASVKHMPLNKVGVLNYPSTKPLTRSVGLWKSQQSTPQSQPGVFGT